MVCLRLDEILPQACRSDLMTGVHAFHVCVQKVLTKTAGILAAQRSSSTALPRPHAFSLAFHGEGYRIEGRITAPSTKGVCTLTLPNR